MPGANVRRAGEDISCGTTIFESGAQLGWCEIGLLAAMADVTACIEKSLESRPGLLVLNKFGKSEAEGEGMRDLIAKALDEGVAVIIGVPERNLAVFRDFAGELSVELPVDPAEVLLWLRRVQPAAAVTASTYN